MNEWMNGRQLEKIIWWIYKEQTMYAMEQKKDSELKQTEYISITLKMKWKKRLATSQHIRTACVQMCVWNDDTTEDQQPNSEKCKHIAMRFSRLQFW